MASRGTPRVTLRLEPPIRAALERIGQRQGVSLTDVIREGIQLVIEKHGEEVKRDEGKSEGK